jgi:hypothetical protein
MNHALWARVGARVIAVAFVVAGAAACDRNKAGDRESAAPGSSSTASTNSGSVIGTPPAPPQGDTPQTTPASKSQSELSKHEESTTKPHEGDQNSFMTESTRDSQRAGKVDAQTQRRQQ